VGKNDNRSRSQRVRDRDTRLNLTYLVKQVIASLNCASVVWLLDQLTRNLICSCGKSDAYECECLPRPSKTIGWLLDHYFELEPGPHDPTRIWAWTRSLVFLGHRAPQDSAAVRALMEDDELRQAIHRLAFANDTVVDQVWETRTRLLSGYRHAGLGMKLIDFFAMSEHALSTGNAALWEGFYSRHNYYAQKKGPDAHRALLRQQARRNPLLLAAWSKLERSAREAEKKDRHLRIRRRRRWQLREEEEQRARRKFYRENKAQVEAGKHWGAVREIADYYLLKRDDRDEILDDPRTAELALLNCFPMLDAYVPALSARSNNERPDIVRVLHAACLATYR
jgi:hypothetical protein